jgi:hypothetical protein
VFNTILRTISAWRKEISDFLWWGGHHETSRDLILLRDRLLNQFALPGGERMQLPRFDYHWWRPVTAPGKINPGLVIPWNRPVRFDYQRQADAFNQSRDDGALRESAWQRRRAMAQRLSLSFARARRVTVPTRSAPSAARAIRGCSQGSAKKPVRNLKQTPPSRTSRRQTNVPRRRQTMDP